jgi:GNAT superfamily N-acetyltransferase
MHSNRLRDAQLTDTPALAAMMVEVYGEAGLALKRDAAKLTFERLIRSPHDGRIWLLETDSMLAGFIVLTLAYAMEYGGQRGFVDDFFVRPPFRRRGLGAAGLAAVKAHCLANGVRALFVQTGPSNDVAQRVYRRAGFEDTGHALLVMPLSKPLHLF